jgi:acyl-CoA thioesterase I
MTIGEADILAKELSVKRASLYGVAILILIGATAAFFAVRGSGDAKIVAPVASATIATGKQLQPKTDVKFILAFGDSLTAGYGLDANSAFPARLEAALKARGLAARVQNAGVSGDTSAVGRGRLDWTLKGAKAKPDLVIIELGGNDMLRGIDPAQTRANLEAMINTLKAQKIRVLIAGMRASPNLGKAYQGQFDPIFPALAAKHGTLLYPFFMEGVAAQMDKLQADGIHPNPIGVDIIVNGIMPYVVKALNERAVR